MSSEKRPGNGIVDDALTRPALTDTHSHLDDTRFADDLDEVLARAKSAGVTRIIASGCDLRSSRAAVGLAERHAGVWATAGFHPHEARHFDCEAAAAIQSLLQLDTTVAVGEIGLDYHYDLSPRDEQRAAFGNQLSLAQTAGLPVVLHCREAYDDLMLELRARASTWRGVMHCWSGTAAQAEQALDLGFHLGIGGVITFRKPGELREVVGSAPLERILLETDAPYLAPVPARGKRNEPALVTLVAQRVAEIRGISTDELAEITTENALTLFGRMR